MEPATICSALVHVCGGTSCWWLWCHHHKRDRLSIYCAPFALSLCHRLYSLTFFSFILAFCYFGLEVFVYKTAPLAFGTVAPAVISGTLCYTPTHPHTQIISTPLPPFPPLPPISCRSHCPLDDLCITTM